MDTYNPEIVRRLSINPVAEQNLLRVATALNGLTRDFGKTWVEANLFGFDPSALSRALAIPVETLVHERADFDDLVFLWEDLETLRCHAGFDQFKSKLSQGRRAHNVDVEISVAADLCRLTCEVELEPRVANGRKTDLRFKARTDDDWTYVEVTRKSAGKVGELIAERGMKLSELVAAREPSRRHFIVITRQMDPDFSDSEFSELVAWIPNSPPSSSFKDYAFVGSVPSNEDETPLVLPYLTRPISVVLHADIDTGASGVAYLRVPDLGAADKIGDKAGQAMEGHESLLFIDLTSTHASQSDWDNQIGTMEVASVFSAVVVTRNQRASTGFTRICKIIEPQTSIIPLSIHTRNILERFSEMRVQRSLS